MAWKARDLSPSSTSKALASRKTVGSQLNPAPASNSRSQYAQRRIARNWRPITKSLGCAPSPFAKSCLLELDQRFSRMTSQTASLPSSNSGWMQPRALRLRFRPAFLLTQVEDEEGRTHLLIHLPIGEEEEHRWCLWRQDQAGFDSRSIFDAPLVRNRKRTIY